MTHNEALKMITALKVDYSVKSELYDMVTAVFMDGYRTGSADAKRIYQPPQLFHPKLKQPTP